MDARKLSLFLILGGAAMTLVAAVWFFVTFADAIEMADSFGGGDYAARFMACLYSSDAMCQGALAFSDGPTYSPVVFWLGVVALLGGIGLRFAVRQGPAASTGMAEVSRTGEIMSFIPPEQYARYSYILALSGAVAGLLIAPLAIIALAAVTLAVLGLTVYRPRLNALDAHHLGLICLVFTASALALLLTRGTFLFLLVALAQIAAFHVAFHSYRQGRSLTMENVKEACVMAFTPGSRPGPAAGRTNSSNPTE